jgi:hypothetical protein
MEFGYNILSLRIYIEKWKFKQVNLALKFTFEMNSSLAPLFLLPHSLNKLELPMNFNIVFKNVKIIKIGLLEVKLWKKNENKFKKC